MKIAMISTDYLPNIGGIAAHIYNLSWALQEIGEDVVVINPVESDSEYFEECKIQGVKVYKVGVNKNNKWYRNKILRKRIFSKKVIDAVKKVEAKHGAFDILHQHDYQDTTLACEKLRGSRRWVWTNHTSRFLRDSARQLKMKYIQRTYREVDAILTVSEEIFSKTESFWPQNSVFYIPNGVNVDRFNSNVIADKSKYNIDDGDFVVLCPRRIAPKNGVIYLARAIENVLKAAPETSWKFIFIGSEEEDSNYKNYIVDVKKVLASYVDQGSAVLLGNIPMEEMPSINALADVIMMPSLMEAVSLSALEGMATQKAMVVSAVGGLPEIVIHEKTGLLVPPKDPVAISNALIRLARNSELRHEVSMAGMELASNEYSWHSVAEKTRTVYEKLL